MAIPTATVWRVRIGGNENNGGGFVPGGQGVDRSQQDAAHASGVNLTVDSSVNTDVTPDGHTPDTADVNNIIQITAGAGFTPGAYHIVSIQSGKWRLDRSPAAVGTGGGVWSLGGALATPGKAGGLHVGGNLIYVDSGTYTFTTGDNNVSNGRITLAAGGASFTRLEGNPASRPIFQWDSNISARLVTMGGNNVVRGIRFAGNAAYGSTGAITRGGHVQEILNCEFTNWQSLWAIAGTYVGNITDCYFYNCKGVSAASWPTIRHCVMKNCQWAVSRGVFDTDGNTRTEWDECIFTGGERCFRIQSGAIAVLRKCIFYGIAGTGGKENAIGYQTNNTGVVDVDSCIFENVVGYGVAGGTNGRVRLLNCAHYNCGGLHDGAVVEEVGTIAGTHSFFVDPAHGDFNINNVAGGGALLRSLTKALAA